MGIVEIKRYEAPPLGYGEMLRYAGVRGEAPEVVARIKELLKTLLPQLTYRVCYTVVELSRVGDEVDLGFVRLCSKTAQRAFEGCDAVLLMVATVGHTLDRAVARLSLTSPAAAQLADAIGTERVEALCDAFCDDAQNGALGLPYVLRPRISPGYGDLPLSLQKELFSLLSPTARIGVALTESLQMIPSKSVSALIGLQKR